METIFLIVLVALIALNVYASRQSYRDALSSRGQRLGQIAFIWLVPVVGAVLALRLTSNEAEQSTGTYRDEPNMADEFAASGRLNSQEYISPIGDNFHLGDGNTSLD